MNNRIKKKISYQDSGVCIKKGNELIQRLTKTTHNTRRKEVIGGLGGFGGLFELDSFNYKNPILVSGTDGVGTKIKFAIENNIHNKIGIDLVAMCVNDIIVHGAEPLFFLDYFACSKLDIDIAETVIGGINEGCSIAGCSLIGGETAEMPGMYKEKDYDLAGFCVGIVEKDKMITGKNIKEGDAIIAVASSGYHANGYSLIRKIIKETNQNLEESIEGKKLIEHLLEPTRIYTKQILKLISHVQIKSIAHITGGGLIENIPRVIPNDFSVTIDSSSWELPAIFKWLFEKNEIERNEMYRTFNCGVGLVLFVDNNEKEKTIEFLNNNDESAWQIGEVTLNKKNKRVDII